MINRKFETFLATLVKDGVAFRRDSDKSIIAWGILDGITRCFGPVQDEKDTDSDQGGKIDLHNSNSIKAMRKAYDHCHSVGNCGGCRLWEDYNG